jgi:ATP-dependent DNA ligase
VQNVTQAEKIRISEKGPYLRTMFKFEFCIPTVGKSVPAGDDWFHEIKYDGYRLRGRAGGDRCSKLAISMRSLNAN